MNLPKITAGPWTADKMLFGNSKDRRSGFVVNGPDAEPLAPRICDMRCSPESPYLETLANARAIAAVPAMLAALNTALSVIEGLPYPQNYPATELRAALILAGCTE